MLVAAIGVPTFWSWSYSCYFSVSLSPPFVSTSNGASTAIISAILCVYGLKTDIYWARFVVESVLGYLRMYSAGVISRVNRCG